MNASASRIDAPRPRRGRGAAGALALRGRLRPGPSTDRGGGCGGQARHGTILRRTGLRARRSSSSGTIRDSPPIRPGTLLQVHQTEPRHAASRCDHAPAVRVRCRSRRGTLKRRDDLAAVDLEDGLFIAVHQVDVELVDARVGKALELGEMVVDRAEHAEAVGHLVADEARVRRPHLGVVEVVVALPVADVAGQRLGQLLARVLVHEVDDVVADEGREPAGPLAAVGEVADVGRRRSLDPDRAGRPAGRGLGVANLADEPGDQVGIGELEDHAIGDPAGHRERHRAVAGDPHRQRPSPSSREVEVRALVGDRLAGDEGPDDPDRLLERRHRGRRLAEHAPGGVAAPDAEVHPAAAELVERGQGRRGHARLARAGFVTHVPSRSRSVAWAMSVRSG